MFTRLWKSMTNFVRPHRNGKKSEEPGEPAQSHSIIRIDLDLAPDDPLVFYLLKGPQVVEIDRLVLDSPALRQLKQQQVKLIVPLISQGELIGMLNLGARLSEQEYSTDDRRLPSRSSYSLVYTCPTTITGAPLPSAAPTPVTSFPQQLTVMNSEFPGSQLPSPVRRRELLATRNLMTS